MNEEIKPVIESDAPGASTTEPSQDSLDRELAEKGLTPEQKEKAKYSIKKTISKLQKKLESIGGELDEEIDLDDEDDKPLTKGEWKRMQAEQAIKTAFQMAESETDPKEKELIKYHLENTIKPSGNAEKDFRNAKAIVSSVKNAQIAELTSKKGTAKTHSSASGAPGKGGEEEFEFTSQELEIMKMGKLSKEEAIKAVKRQREKDLG